MAIDYFTFGYKTNKQSKGCMVKKHILVGFAALLFFSVHAFGWKDISHYISLPLIEGGGIYSSVKALSVADLSTTKAAAGTNIGLLASNATLGTIAFFLEGDARSNIRTVHRIVGFTLTAAAVWLSIQMSVDDNMKEEPARYISYGYAGLTVVPIILFSF
jgi:hypothetical protein